MLITVNLETSSKALTGAKPDIETKLDESIIKCKCMKLRSEFALG